MSVTKDLATWLPLTVEETAKVRCIFAATLYVGKQLQWEFFVNCTVPEDRCGKRQKSALFALIGRLSR